MASDERITQELCKLTNVTTEQAKALLFWRRVFDDQYWRAEQLSAKARNLEATLKSKQKQIERLRNERIVVWYPEQ